MQDDIFAENMKVIAERWPLVAKRLASVGLPAQIVVIEGTPETTFSVSGIHLSSCYDRQSEALLQSSLVPDTARNCWIYGLGLGDLPEALLQREQLRKVSVVLLNSEISRLSFSSIDHRNWLTDPRLQLLLAENIEGLQAPFAAVPPELQLAEDGATRLRDQVLLELSTPFIRSKQGAGNAETQIRLLETRPFVVDDGDVATLFGMKSGETVLVAGAGPTLADQYEWIRQQSDAFLIAVDTAVKPLLSEGICPDVVVAIDPSHHEELALFAGIDSALLAQIPLVYFPRVHPEVLNCWPGPRLAAYSSESGYQQQAAEIPKGKLYSSGTVFHPAVDLAVRVGAQKIVLLGADFSYPNGMSHVPGSAHSKSRILRPGDPWVLDSFGKKIATAANLRGFLRDLEDYITLWPQVQFVNASRKGALIQGTSYLEG